MDTEQTVEQKRAIWQRVNPTLQPYPAEADAVNVCCMGVNAREDVEVIQGFIEEELADDAVFVPEEITEKQKAEKMG